MVKARPKIFHHHILTTYFAFAFVLFERGSRGVDELLEPIRSGTSKGNDTSDCAEHKYDMYKYQETHN